MEFSNSIQNQKCISWYLCLLRAIYKWYNDHHSTRSVKDVTDSRANATAVCKSEQKWLAQMKKITKQALQKLIVTGFVNFVVLLYSATEVFLRRAGQLS